jgi:hypothetical protein
MWFLSCLSVTSAWVVASALLPVDRVHAQPAPVTPHPVLTWFVPDTTRLELWSFFTPPPGGGDPDYVHLGNRLFFGVEGRRQRVDFTAGLQYVQFGWLPRDASAPARSEAAVRTSSTPAAPTAGSCTSAR